MMTDKPEPKMAMCINYQQTAGCYNDNCQFNHLKARERFKHLAPRMFFRGVGPEDTIERITLGIRQAFSPRNEVIGEFYVFKNEKRGVAHVVFKSWDRAQVLIDMGNLHISRGDGKSIRLKVHLPRHGFLEWGRAGGHSSYNLSNNGLSLKDDQANESETRIRAQPGKKQSLCTAFQTTTGCPKKDECPFTHVKARDHFTFLAARCYFRNVPDDLTTRTVERLIGESFGGRFSGYRSVKSGVVHVIFQTWNMAQPLIDQGYLEVRNYDLGTVFKLPVHIPPGPFHTWDHYRFNKDDSNPIRHHFNRTTSDDNMGMQPGMNMRQDSNTQSDMGMFLDTNLTMPNPNMQSDMDNMQSDTAMHMNSNPNIRPGVDMQPGMNMQLDAQWNPYTNAFSPIAASSPVSGDGAIVSSSPRASEFSQVLPQFVAQSPQADVNGLVTDANGNGMVVSNTGPGIEETASQSDSVELNASLKEMERKFDREFLRLKTAHTLALSNQKSEFDTETIRLNALLLEQTSDSESKLGDLRSNLDDLRSKLRDSKAKLGGLESMKSHLLSKLSDSESTQEIVLAACRHDLQNEHASEMKDLRVGFSKKFSDSVERSKTKQRLMEADILSLKDELENAKRDKKVEFRLNGKRKLNQKSAAVKCDRCASLSNDNRSLRAEISRMREVINIQQSQSRQTVSRSPSRHSRVFVRRGSTRTLPESTRITPGRSESTRITSGRSGSTRVTSGRSESNRDTSGRSEQPAAKRPRPTAVRLKPSAIRVTPSSSPAPPSSLHTGQSVSRSPLTELTAQPNANQPRQSPSPPSQASSTDYTYYTVEGENQTAVQSTAETRAGDCIDPPEPTLPAEIEKIAAHSHVGGQMYFKVKFVGKPMANEDWVRESDLRSSVLLAEYWLQPNEMTCQ
eukprot:235494_1